LFTAITPFYLGKLIDAATSSEQAFSWENALVYLLPYILLQIGAVLFTITAEYVIASKSEYISHELRLKLFNSVFHDKIKHDNSREHDRGMVLSLFNRDVEVLWDLFGYAITELLASIVIIITMCCVVLIINPIVGASLIILSLSFVIASYINGYHIRAHFAKAAPKFDRMINFINTALDGYDTIASFICQKWARKEVNLLSNNVSLLANKAHRHSSLFSFSVSIINILYALGLWLVCLPGLYGEPDSLIQITIGEFVALLFYLSMVMHPLETISGSAKVFSKSFVSIKRIREFSDSFQKEETLVDNDSIYNDKQDDKKSKEITEINKKNILSVRNLELEIANSDYTNKNILKNISFNIYSNQMVGLAGSSGAGKSVLLRVLARLQTASNGEVLLNNQNVNMWNELDFRASVIYITQTPAIFPVNLKENIMLGEGNNQNGNIEAISINKILEKASFSRAMEQLGEVEDITDVGLSGGEKQRISLARGMAKQGHLFIFDEPTSALDRNNCRKISQSLRNLAQSKYGTSVIVASHDSNVLEKCDLIILMSDGEIKGIDNHTVLTQTSELYKKIIADQL
jgi:ATP-binding cassette subfamily B protein